MKILVISDIHGRNYAFDYPNRIEHDQVIFLGDYFDAKNDEELDEPSKTCEALLKSFQNPKHIHLLGNHDTWYACQEPYLRCSGNTSDKHQIISKYFDQSVWKNQFKLIHMVDNIVFSHAGLHEGIFPPVTMNVPEFIINSGKRAWENIFLGTIDPLLKGSMSRGFHNVEWGKGGCTWMDWDELPLIPDIIQVVGHTNRQEVRCEYIRKNTFNICLDTFNQHVLVIDTEKDAVKEKFKCYSVYMNGEIDGEVDIFSRKQRIYDNMAWMS